MSLTAERGVSIIEASAGTGKTYTLCRIVLRLVIENAIPIDRILAITFTQAATEELKSRIRELLQECARQMSSDTITEPVLLEALANGNHTLATIHRRLRHSLEIFDDASIFTIHGFCKRSLEFISLESDIGLDANLEPVDDQLVERLKNEYIRIQILERSALLSAAYTRSNTLSEQLDNVGRQCAAHPSALLEPNQTDSQLASLEHAYQSCIQSIPAFLEEVPGILNALKKNSSLFRFLNQPENIDRLQALSTRPSPLAHDLNTLETLRSENWGKALLKSEIDRPSPELCARADAFHDALDTTLQTIVARYRDWLFTHLRSEKERLNVISFNDLLHSLNRALRDADGDRAAQAIADQYDAVLLDEFQDTDPVQFNIVQRLFSGDDKRLFLIGDPKQAIYRFRGADIFAYFHATDSNDYHRLALEENYRSTPTLVDAVNTLFEAAPDGFAFDRIQFHPVRAARQSPIQVPLQVEAIGFDGDSTLTDGEATRLLARAASLDLVERVNEDPAFDLGTVAFLVSKNREADIFMESLAQCGIDAVIKAERSVFQTPEAETLLQLLNAVSNPSKRSAVKALLMSPIGGYRWDEIVSEDFESNSQNIAAFLRDWNRNWQSTHFDSAFQTLLRLTGADQRLMRSPSGERQYTNLRQLSELLQNESRLGSSTPTHLIVWITEKRNENVSNVEDWQVRLASDEGKPQIVTIHKSKGLQFPIVICPFMSLLRPKPNPKIALYHDRERSDNLVINFAPQEQSAASIQATREEYAEQIRLIYVALTRAVDECRLYLSPEKSKSKTERSRSSFCQLVLGEDAATSIDNDLDASSTLLQRIQNFDSSLIETRTRSVNDLVSAPLSLVNRQPDSFSPIKALPIPAGTAPRFERILSFSTISRIARSQQVAPDELFNDETALERETLPNLPENSTEPSQSGPHIFSLPKGAQTGNLIHAIFEEADFQDTRNLYETVSQTFNRLRYGYAEYKPILCDHVRMILERDLAEGISLGKVEPEQRIPELEFAYPTGQDALRKMARAFEEHPSPGIPRSWAKSLPLRDAHADPSFLRGFVDLVFEFSGKLFIIDWKSNHLGDRPADYNPSALAEAMGHHDYYLQYCLYSVALLRYLRLRYPTDDPHERFGGVFYLFIRGIEDDGFNGIFYDKPDSALLNALDQALAP